MLNISNHQGNENQNPKELSIPLHLPEWLLSKRQGIKNFDQNVEGNPAHCCRKYKLVQPLWQTVWRFLKNFKLALLWYSAFPPLIIHLKKMKSISQKDICTPHLLQFIYNSWDMETTQVSFDRWMDKENMIKKEKFSQIYNNMNESWGHNTKWNKSGRQSQILYKIIYMWTLRHRYRNIHTQTYTHTDTHTPPDLIDTENRLGV